MIKEFKEFAIKGSVVDLAVGVIIGAAFGKIVSSFIDDILTPVLLQPALKASKVSDLHALTIWGTVRYGNFLSNILYFILIAFVLFAVIKLINQLKKKQPPVTTPSNMEKLLMEIRDNTRK